VSEGEFSHWKPLDFGADGITGSVDAEGRIIALNTYDPVHGYITLTSAEPFPDEDRYDPAKVRAYRAGLARLAGFGKALTPNPSPSGRGETSADSGISVMHGGVVQRLDGVEAGARFRGRISLQRCAYTQLTEGGVLPMPPLQMTVSFHDGTLTITNPALGRSSAITGFGDGEAFTVEADAPVEFDLPLPEGDIALTYTFGVRPEDALTATRNLQERQADFEPVHENLLVQRGLSYGRVMCVPVGDTVCILTDHMLLPLSWNRDAYYVALALLHGAKDGAEVVRRHLRWMFTVAERIDGDWGRCYLVNGDVKDKAYQLDQQVYPLLELADYAKKTGDTALLNEMRPQVYAVLDALSRHKDAEHALYATDETPGDDPIALPYHLSSHILLWRTLTQLSDVLEDAGLAAWAEIVRAAVNKYFVVETEKRERLNHRAHREHRGTQRNSDDVFHPLADSIHAVPTEIGESEQTKLYAYAVDGHGGHYLYHDANDVPLALAPAWGYCAADDAVWRNTVDYAFSADNPGVYSGRLGSVHTPGPWALGDLQDVIVARALKDKAREDAAWARLRRGAAFDGALPEAYDAETGAAISRTWFAWPNTVAACIACGCWL
jgi:uncharacterized protein